MVTLRHCQTLAPELSNHIWQILFLSTRRRRGYHRFECSTDVSWGSHIFLRHLHNLPQIICDAISSAFVDQEAYHPANSSGRTALWRDYVPSTPGRGGKSCQVHLGYLGRVTRPRRIPLLIWCLPSSPRQRGFEKATTDDDERRPMATVSLAISKCKLQLGGLTGPDEERLSQALAPPSSHKYILSFSPAVF